MRFWLRLSPRTGVSMPWYLAIVVYSVWLCIWLVGLMLLAALALVLLGVHGMMRAPIGSRRRTGRVSELSRGAASRLVTDAMVDRAFDAFRQESRDRDRMRAALEAVQDEIVARHKAGG